METGGMLRFLVVEDHLDVARAVCRVLNRHGSARIAPTRSAALRDLDVNSPAGCVVDIALPDGSGFDVARAARAKSSATRVTMLSGSVNHAYLAAAHALEAEYLLKPISSANLDLFAMRVRAAYRREKVDPTEVTLLEFQGQFSLTQSEAALLRLAASGTRRADLAAIREVEESTVKTQIASLLRKTGHGTLDEVLIALLRTVARRG